jgi:hypothetical protein
VRFGRIADVMVDKVGDYMIGNVLISLAAALKVVLAERLHERDATDADSSVSGNREAALPLGPADGATPAPASTGDAASIPAPATTDRG